MSDARFLVLACLKELAVAIREEREASSTGEYTDGNLWRVDESISRLEAFLCRSCEA